MRRLLLDSLWRQVRESRGATTLRHCFASESQPVNNRRLPIYTNAARLKATRATSVDPRPSDMPVAGLNEAWGNAVTEGEAVTVSPVTSPREEVMTSLREKLDPDEQIVPEESLGGVSTTLPPYLDFDSAKPFSEMPAPFSLPIIGTSWMVMPGGPLHGMSFEQKTHRLYEMYGPIIRENVMLGYTMVHVYRPEDMEAVYRVQGNRPKREAFRMLQKYNKLYSDGVQGVLTSHDDEWHHLRSQSQGKMLKPKSASAYLDLHNGVSDDFVKAIERLKGPDGIIENLLPELYKFGMEGIGCVCFNRRVGALDENIPADSDAYRFIRSVSHVMEATHSEITKIFLFRHSTSFRKLVEAQGFIKKLSRQEAMRTLDSFAQTDRTVDGESGDLIPYLITKTQLTEQEVMILISEFFFAGVDTTSHLLGFSLYLLGKNPEAQEKLCEEIERIIPRGEPITANMLGRMSYLKAITKETVRMMPITPGNGRTLHTDVVLSGYVVPAGTPMGLHHDWAGKSPHHVKEADRFEPARWLRGNKSPLGDMHPFTTMPFGFGTRSCLGRRFAEQEYALGLIKILQKFRVEYASNEDVWVEMCTVNKPQTPLRFRFIPRV